MWRVCNHPYCRRCALRQEHCQIHDRMFVLGVTKTACSGTSSCRYTAQLLANATLYQGPQLAAVIRPSNPAVNAVEDGGIIDRVGDQQTMLFRAGMTALIRCKLESRKKKKKKKKNLPVRDSPRGCCRWRIASGWHDSNAVQHHNHHKNDFGMSEQSSPTSIDITVRVAQQASWRKEKNKPAFDVMIQSRLQIACTSFHHTFHINIIVIEFASGTGDVPEAVGSDPADPPLACTACLIHNWCMAQMLGDRKVTIPCDVILEKPCQAPGHVLEPCQEESEPFEEVVAFSFGNKERSQKLIHWSWARLNFMEMSAKRIRLFGKQSICSINSWVGKRVKLAVRPGSMMTGVVVVTKQPKPGLRPRCNDNNEHGRIEKQGTRLLSAVNLQARYSKLLGVSRLTSSPGPTLIMGRGTFLAPKVRYVPPSQVPYGDWRVSHD
ncbi:hypothetical protein OOU_Y34scaffold00765g130 [Pyricularia oryzae Y34]|uniref:Uncharacterized protein n=1 Tax=Pyricularia oryzae (strain Y34) TaxID=1143189 RepID=A0AA97NQN8_PYRO3|nr:hypothetical protein OOU_Y34scaffold00765g130 [Pyricularia oryzae Y34]